METREWIANFFDRQGFIRVWIPAPGRHKITVHFACDTEEEQNTFVNRYGARKAVAVKEDVLVYWVNCNRTVTVRMIEDVLELLVDKKRHAELILELAKMKKFNGRKRIPIEEVLARTELLKELQMLIKIDREFYGEDAL
jgi:predicted nucleic acid-binding OB-fold protein